MILTWVAPDNTTLVFSRDATDYKLTKNYTGLSSTPVYHSTTRAPYQHGATLINSTLQNRSIGFEIMIMAPDLETLQARIRALVSALNPTQGPGHLIFTNEAGVEYWVSAIGNGTPTLSTSDRAREYQRAYIDLVAFDPYWYSGAPKVGYLSPETSVFFPFSVPFTIGRDSPNITCENAGDVTTPVTILIHGAFTTPVITNVTTGEAITVNITMAEGDTFVITTGFGNKTATYTPSGGTAVNGFAYIDATSVLWSLAKGTNTLSLSCAASGSGDYVRVEWNDRYVGV